MTMKTISETEFLEIAKEILFEECIVRNKDALTNTSSFKYQHDLSSIDVAQTVIAIEGRYNVDMDFVKVDQIDSLQDIYTYFLKALENKRKNARIKVPEYSLSFDNVFYTVKSMIIATHSKIPADKLTKEAKMGLDLKLNYIDIIKLITELEQRYHLAIPMSYKAEEAKTLGEFCQICSDTLKKRIELPVKYNFNNVVRSTIEIIATRRGISPLNLSSTTKFTSSKLRAAFKDEDEMLYIDDTEKEEIIIELEKVYRVAISDEIVKKSAGTINEFCVLCKEEIDKKIPLNNQLDKSVTYLSEKPNLFKEIKQFYQSLRAK